MSGTCGILGWGEWFGLRSGELCGVARKKLVNLTMLYGAMLCYVVRSAWSVVGCFCRVCSFILFEG